MAAKDDGIRRFRASHQYARISPTKVRKFADLIRGRDAQTAVELLKFVPNRGARMLEKVLKSAMANAEQGGARNIEKLTVLEAHVDGGPMFKRVFPRARGMAYLIRRRFAHIHVTLN